MRVFIRVHQSRIRLALALAFISGGLVAAVGAAISNWYATSIITSVLISAGMPSILGAATTLAAAALGLASLGFLVAALPLPWPPAAQSVQSLPALPESEQEDVLPTPLEYGPVLPDPIINAPFGEDNPIPMVSVYVDAENKRYRVSQLTAFFRLIDAEIGNQRADRFYYMDALRDNVKDFRETYEKGGFTLKDAPHKALAAPMQLSGAHTVNAVDIAMALDIIERALLGPQGQKIILVTADHDYFPLLSRLKRLGRHTVLIWARSPAPRFISFCDGLGFSVRDLDQEPTLRTQHAPRKER